MAAQPLNYAGGSNAPPLAAPAGGTITLGPTTYAVSSIGAVQVQTDLEPRDFVGWLGVMGVTLSVLCAVSAVAMLLMSATPDAREGGKTLAGIIFLAALVLSPSFWLAVRFGRQTRYQVALFVAGQPHIFLTPNEAAAFQLREQIVAAMAAGGGNVYIDNRQIHIHKH